MNATFGKLRDSTLELKDGLNILQAPTEAGKSTWCAFLLSMFYGVDPLEERYLPWSGEAMRGEIDCYALGREWTLRRSTPRPDRPLAALEAVCMDGGGPGQEAPELSGENCGETLLGVTREVYEQGALIRRAGVSALPGVPDGQSGQTAQRLAEYRERLEQLEQREAELNQELDSMDRWEAAKNRKALSASKGTTARAGEYAAALRRELDARNIPELDAISRMRGAIVNLRTIGSQVQRAEAEQEDAEQALREAEEAAARSPFAGRTPEEAERLPPNLPPRPKVPVWLKIPLGLSGGAMLAFLFFHIGWAAVLVDALVLAFLLGALWLIQQRKNSWDAMAARRLKRRKNDLERYALLCRNVEKARDNAAARAAAATAMRVSLSSHEQALLREVRRFAPDANSLSAADERVRDAARRRKELSAAQTALQEAGNTGTADAEETPLPEAPSRSREEAILALASLREELANVRSEISRLTGQPESGTDEAASERTEDGSLSESAVIRLSLESLRRASAALGASARLERRTAGILRTLTEGRYGGAALEEALYSFTRRISVPMADGVPAANGEADDKTEEDPNLFFAGCAQPLYLAVRVAVCESMLPPALPMVMDDTLYAFDGRHSAAALRFLKQEGRRRQILLFTLRQRDADFFAGDGEVSVQRLL